LARKKHPEDPNVVIVMAHRQEIDALRAQGKKPGHIAEWLVQFGFTGTGTTLNGILPWRPGDVPVSSVAPASPPRRRIGYARVSTDDQNLDLQLDALRGTGIPLADIYQEKLSGSKADRPELDHTLKALRPGDILVVWRLDRLGRSLPDLVRIITDLEEKGIGFESLTEKIDTTTAAGKLMFHVFAALAEFERNIIRERTRAGLNAARARGRKGGRKPALTEKQIREIRALLRDPAIQVIEVAKRYGISRSTLYKHAGAVSPDRI